MQLVLTTDAGRLEMGKSRNSDWPAVFFLLLLVGALLTAFTPYRPKDSNRRCEKVAEPSQKSNTTPQNANTS